MIICLIEKGGCQNVNARSPLYWDEVTLALMQAATDKALNTYNQRKAVKIVIHSVEAYAIKNGITDRRLAEYIELPEQTTPDKHPFTDEEVSKLWTAYNVGDEVAGALLIMIYTGMRFGEFSTIDPVNIHLSEGYLTGGIKTEAGKADEILILPQIAPVIEKLMLPVNRFAVSNTAFTKRMRAALDKAGCQQHTAHECRHTTATFLARAGVQPAIISDIMRHTNYQQTLAYTHIDRQTKLDALSKSITYK